jgi:pimeloyl-ACP methyl ester carboxylesterase
MKQRKKIFISCLLVFSVFVLLLSCGKGDGVKEASSFDSVDISYEAVGEGEPALVFVHGWSCSRAHWNAQKDYFSKKYRVVMLDLAGHGASGKNRNQWTMEAFGKDVAAVVKKEKLTKVILIGHSMGGVVVLNAAKELSWSVVGIVGVDNLHDVEVKLTKEQIEEFVSPFRKDFEGKKESFFKGMFPKGTDPVFIEKAAAGIKADPDIAVTLLEEFCRTDQAKLVKETEVPIHLINTDLWPSNVQAGKRQAGSSFELTLIKGAGHFPMIEVPEKFNMVLENVVESFLKQ